jgi:protein required for attachment to host cells/ribosome-associated translation inhibitor RaiA
MNSLKIQFRDMRPSAAISAVLEDSVRDLETYDPSIMSCDVVVSKPHRKHTKGGIYHVVVRFRVAGEQIVINREPEKDHAHEDVYVAIRDAFSAARRRLQNHLDKHGHRASRKKAVKGRSKRGAKFDLEVENEITSASQALASENTKVRPAKKTAASSKTSETPTLSWERAEDREITWIAVCNRAGARIFKKQFHDVELFHSLDYPLGRERTRALRTDKPSVSRMNFAAGGGTTHRMTGGKDPHEELAVAFSKTVGAYLKNAFQKKQFEHLVVVAEPHFLGLIKLSLDKKVQASVSQWVAKDLVRFSIFNVKKLFLSEKELKNIRFKTKTR